MRRKPVRWSANLAYAIGLIATDGCLSNDGRHITLVSKDVEQLENFALALSLKVSKSRHVGGVYPNKVCYRIQFGDVVLYDFLVGIGLTSHKTATIAELRISDKYFCHFLRGHLDGDGSTYSYWDTRWRNSFLFYTTFISLSLAHMEWLQKKVKELYGIEGTIRKTKLRSGNYMCRLEYAKVNSVKLMKYLYPKNKKILYLKRKKFKIDQALGIIAQQAGMAKLVYA